MALSSYLWNVQQTDMALKGSRVFLEIRTRNYRKGGSSWTIFIVTSENDVVYSDSEPISVNVSASKELLDPYLKPSGSTMHVAVSVTTSKLQPREPGP